MSERDASGSCSLGVNLGEDKGDWLGGSEDPREEIWF